MVVFYIKILQYLKDLHVYTTRTFASWSMPLADIARSLYYNKGLTGLSFVLTQHSYIPLETKLLENDIS